MGRPIDEEQIVEDSYAEMSLDVERERDAAEWIEGLIADAMES